MEFRVLAVGDVVGTPGLDHLRKHLPKLRRKYGVDFCVVNGENAAMVGMTASQGETIFDAGADVITLGNHTWNQREICSYLDDNSHVLRPANFAPQLPGSGVGVFDTDYGPIAVVNLVGRCGMDFNADNPFTKIDGILKKLEGMPVLVDFHAEEKKEKLAMAFYLDGKVSTEGWGPTVPGDGPVTSLDRAIELIQRNTRHYAKRQLSYWGRDKDIRWMEL